MWKQIKGFEGYFVNEKGDILSKKDKKEKLLVQSKLSAGYLVVSLSNRKIIKTKSVHRIVGEAFIPNPESKPEINHIDGDKTNNKVSNLEWNTSLENTRHAIDNKLWTPRWWAGKFGKDNPKSKPVNQLTPQGILKRKFNGIREAGRETRISPSSISSVCRNKSETAGGYGWEYSK